MRVLAISILGLVLVTVASAARLQPQQESTPGEAVFVVSGRGWGHGVGMSQYGALGQAKEGKSYDEILAYYYYGTKLGRTSKKDVRVLLAEGRRALTISSPAPFSVVDAAGTRLRILAGAMPLKPGLEVVSEDGPVPAQGPLVVRPGKAPLSLDGRPYRGKLEVAVQGGFMRAVNIVALDGYLHGVVPGEMPRGWPAEALKAQAVAARTYALSNLVKGKPFELYSDVRSQAYGGLAAEALETTEAVQATAGEIVTFGGKPALTFYFSTSGGKTASAADVFGLSLPYLISRPDPWDKASPYHRWGPLVFGARTVQSKLALQARVLDAAGTPTPSGRLRSLTLETLGGPTTVPSALLRTGLGLRSTWITMGVVRLDRPRTSTVVFGSSLSLTGLARGVTAPQLASSPDGKSWTPAGALERAPDGSFSRAVKPTQTSRYRVQAERVASQAVVLRVAPRLRLTRPAEPGVLTGTVRPRAEFTVVHVERLKGAAWAHVAEVLTDGSGAFRAELDVVPGTYRAHVYAAGALAEGISPTLVVGP